MHDFSYKEFWRRGTEPFRKHEQPPVKDGRVPGCPSSKNIRRKAYKDSFQTVFYEAIPLLKCPHSPLHFVFFSDQTILEENTFRQNIPQVRTTDFRKRVCEIKGFYKGRANHKKLLILRPKLGV